MITPNEAKTLQETNERQLADDVKQGNVKVLENFNNIITKASRDLSNDVERANVAFEKIKGDIFRDIFGNKFNIIEVRVALESAGWKVLLRPLDEKRTAIIVKW